MSLIESLPPDVGMVFCRTRSILENGLLVKLHWQRAGGYDFDDFVVRNNPAGNGSSILVRASCFAEVGGFDERLPFAEDLEMWLRIAERSASPVLWGSRHFLVDRRLRPGAATRDTTTAEAILDELLAHPGGQTPPAPSPPRPTSGPHCWPSSTAATPRGPRTGRNRLGRRASPGWLAARPDGSCCVARDARRRAAGRARDGGAGPHHGQASCRPSSRLVTVGRACRRSETCLVGRGCLRYRAARTVASPGGGLLRARHGYRDHS